MQLTLRQIAETAAFASARSTSLIEGREPFSESHLQEYWRCSRGRLIDWTRQLDELSERASYTPRDQHEEIWQAAEPVCSEIFVTEILTRVWATVLGARDVHRNDRAVGPIGVHTFKGHMQIRNRAMSLILHELNVPISQLAGVDRLRRRSERWSDLLIGHLVINYQLDEFAFESSRSIEFGQTQIKEILRATDEPVWEFIQTGLRLAFPGHHDAELASDVWNRGIVRSIVGAFSSDSFDDMGTFKSLQRLRLERNGDGQKGRLPGLHSRGVNAPETAFRLRFADLKRRVDQPEN
jgi:hypothetical protein